MAVVSVDDPRVHDYGPLGDPRELHARGLFVAEGRLLVERMLLDRRHAVDSLLLNPASREALCHALEIGPSPMVFECQTGDFEFTTGFNIHRGCLAPLGTEGVGLSRTGAMGLPCDRP